MDFNSPELIAFIKTCIQEDQGDGDHSSLASIPTGTQGHSRLLLKENGVIAGLELAKTILNVIDPKIVFIPYHKDGEQLPAGTLLAEARGSAHSLLLAERLLLNFMQRLSGIATQTAAMVKLTEGYKAKILDTRKTTPGLRLLEKWAVKTGGGENHRIGLYDMVMLKDNHNDSAGGITAAVNRTVEYLKAKQKDLKIEVETRNLDEVKEALNTGAVDRIMLDNFTPSTCKEAVDFIAGRCETEASGGINASNLRDYAASGVDYISLGALTHSVKSLDISMKTHSI
ncbi:MAG: carboxylating nicotinate-nucleotide diphosphorylase [Sphingomonadales bacterium]|nr:carboxylating nicotinate-nucleotide diphosphorylase [Sphingomonadales bacterium]